MRSPLTPQNHRRILCVFPRYALSFGTFQHAYPLMDGVRAFMPPQGILVIAAYLPAEWDVRLVDENIRPATEEELEWADVVLVSGMHVQRAEINDIARRVHAKGKPAALGGPSVSACPEDYPDFDYLHVGEMGDATDALIAAIDQNVSRPPEQRRFETGERLPLADFPVPAYHLIEGRRYFLGSIQYSSGCPYRCEFCDIPSLYGRQPRLKRPEQILEELEALLACGITGSVYFVDDNFIANKKAARTLLPHLVEWQRRRGFPLQLSCEATLNIALCSDILEMMHDAYFCTVFCGIETPELGALGAIQKSHNLAMPILDAVAELNRHGLEVVSGIILGLDTDTPATGRNLIDFIDRSHIPVLTINLLQALPKTPLWDRLAAAGRLTDDASRQSNVVFARPYGEVLESWRAAIRHAYRPEAIYERFGWNLRHTYSNRLRPPISRGRVTPANLRRGLVTLTKLIVKAGIFGRYRRIFWQMAGAVLRTGRIEHMIQIGLVAHHMIRFAEECAEGRQNASFYADRAAASADLAPAARDLSAA